MRFRPGLWAQAPIDCWAEIGLLNNVISQIAQMLHMSCVTWSAFACFLLQLDLTCGVERHLQIIRAILACTLFVGLLLGAIQLAPHSD